MTEKILLISSRQCCYNSASFFADALAKEFCQMGIEVEFCRLWDEAFPKDEADEKDGSSDTLEIDPEAEEYLCTFIGKKYKAIIDFNSRLPRLVMDDGLPYLDHIDAPFYDYILDNPLYHHKSLACRINSYHVITLDLNHADYIRRYYPHIKSVDVQTLGADEIPHVPFDEKEKCILISGSYKRPKTYRQVIELENEDSLLSQMMLEAADEILSDDDMTIERSFRRILEECGYSDPTHRDPRFADLMHELCVLENYLRFTYRKALVDALVDNRVPLKLVGTGWYKYDRHDAENVTIQMPVDYGESYRTIVQSSILGDIAPFFKRGIHDRIPAGFSAGTMIFSDYNPLKAEKFCGGKNAVKHAAGSDSSILNIEGSKAQVSPACILTYTYHELTDPALAKDKCDELLDIMNDRAGYTRMTDLAYEIYKKEYTWKHVAENIFKML